MLYKQSLVTMNCVIHNDSYIVTIPSCRKYDCKIDILDREYGSEVSLSQVRHLPPGGGTPLGRDVRSEKKCVRPKDPL